MTERPDETREFLETLYQNAKQEGEGPAEVADRIYQNARGVSRRELMQGGAALGVGGLLGGGGGYAMTQEAAADPSTSDSDGNVGTPGDRVDVFADGVSAAELFTGAQTIYVRSDGGDSNSGTSESDAKATIDAAISEPALHLDGSTRLVIDVGPGTFGAANFLASQVTGVRLRGATDGDGNPATVLDGGGDVNTVNTVSTNLLLENVVVQNGSWTNVRAIQRGAVETDNVEFRGGDNVAFNIRGAGGGSFGVRGTCSFNWDAGDSSASSHAELIGATGRVDGATLSGSGGQGCVSVKQSGYMHLNETSLDGGGSGACLAVIDSSNVKLGGTTVTFENASHAILTEKNSSIADKTSNGVTYNSIGNEWKNTRGSYATASDGTEIRTLPKNSDNAAVDAAFGGQGWDSYLHFNESEGVPYAKDPSEQEWLRVGRRVASEGTMTISAGSTSTIYPSLNAPGVLTVFPQDTSDLDFMVDWDWKLQGGDWVIKIHEEQGSNPAPIEYIVYEV